MNALVVPLRREDQQSGPKPMKQLEFIPDPVYRSTLEESFAELEAVAATGSWRSAMLLAGGLFESILAMFLLTKKQPASTGPDPRKLPIDKIMGACVKYGMQVAGNKEAKKLVLQYRKLIHPNADIRLRAQVLEADVREAHMVLNSVLEFISPTPIPWEQEEEPEDNIMELEIEGDDVDEAPWEQQAEPSDEYMDIEDNEEPAQPNIRAPRAKGEPQDTAIREDPVEPQEQANIRLPETRRASASTNGTVPKNSEPQAQSNIRQPGNRNVAAPRREQAQEVNDAPEASVQTPEPAPAKKPADVKVEASQSPAPAKPAGEADPRAAIRAMETAIDRNLRGTQLQETISALDKAVRYDLLKNHVPKQALRIHIGKEELSEVDRTAALMTLRDMFRQLLETQSSDVRAEILSEQAAGLSADPPTKGVVYVDYFFEAGDLEYLPQAVASVAKKHIFQRMENHQNRFFLDSITNIWFYLTKEEIDEFTNVCLSCVIYGATHELRMETKGWLKRNSWEKMDSQLRSDVLAPLQRWIENYEFFNDESHANLVRELKAIAERR